MTTATTATVIPFLRYDDARAATTWLVKALGFEERSVHSSPDGGVGHAELGFADGMVMLGPSKDDALGIETPRQLGGTNQGNCLAVPDPDGHHRRAVAAGAEIVAPLADTDYGSRGYSCRDPEGHLWSISTYRAAGAASVTPYLQYADARAAIDWLRQAFGFAEGLLVPGPDGTIRHAELLAAGGVVMVGSQTDNALGLAAANRLGAVNQGIYVVVADPDAHHRRAAAAGARVVIELADTSYGSREYTCRDPEGNVWSFGSYRP
jgi:uncharacterized glyoxalase superfamily protein PhnB